jgi:capsular exopolysaccharide synthesis family protein
MLGLVGTLLMTPVYTASTTLQIDREAARVYSSEDVNPRESMIQGEEFFQTQYGLLRSRSLAERVIADLGLATSDEFLVAMGTRPPAAGEGGAARLVQRRQQSVLAAVQNALVVTPTRGSRLVTVSFESPDRDLSARIANSFATNFIESNLDRKFQSSVYARDFLEERIAQTKTKLEEAERGLVAYATDQQIINVREANATPGAEAQSLASTNLGTINAALATAIAARVSAEEKWRQARRTAIMTLPEVLQNPAIQRLTEERARIGSEYQQKLSVFQADYPEMQQLKSRIDELDRQIAELAGQVRASIQSQYLVALNQERSLQAQVDLLKGDVMDVRSRSIEYNILQREVDTSRTLYEGLLQRYKEVSVTGGITANNISIIDQAKPPRSPSKPVLLLNLVLAALFGLGFGIVAAFVVEALDETLASPEDVEAKLGIPVLGAIPRLEPGISPLEALEDIRSGFSEAYYSLRTALQFSTTSGAPKIILVTSARPAEGKSTTAAALAQSFARVGQRVLLIDGDLRNPSMHRLMKISNDRGMSNVMSGASTIAQMVQRSGVENLDLISCGPLPPNPAELWGSDRVRSVMEDCRNSYDQVVIDGPPILGFADVPLLASAVDGTLFVLESGRTRRGQARGALRRLHIGLGKLLGVAITKVDMKSVAYGGYDYGYTYGYGGEPEAKQKPAKVKAAI